MIIILLMLSTCRTTDLWLIYDLDIWLADKPMVTGYDWTQSHCNTVFSCTDYQNNIYPKQCRGAKSFSNDISLSQDIITIFRIATASLQSFATKPFDWEIFPHKMDSWSEHITVWAWLHLYAALFDQDTYAALFDKDRLKRLVFYTGRAERTSCLWKWACNVSHTLGYCWSA